MSAILKYTKDAQQEQEFEAILCGVQKVEFFIDSKVLLQSLPDATTPRDLPESLNPFNKFSTDQLTGEGARMQRMFGIGVMESVAWRKKMIPKDLPNKISLTHPRCDKVCMMFRIALNNNPRALGWIPVHRHTPDTFPRSETDNNYSILSRPAVSEESTARRIKDSVVHDRFQILHELEKTSFFQWLEKKYRQIVLGEGLRIFNEHFRRLLWHHKIYATADGLYFLGSNFVLSKHQVEEYLNIGRYYSSQDVVPKEEFVERQQVEHMHLEAIEKAAPAKSEIPGRHNETVLQGSAATPLASSGHGVEQVHEHDDTMVVPSVEIPEQSLTTKELSKITKVMLAQLSGAEAAQMIGQFAGERLLEVLGREMDDNAETAFQVNDFLHQRMKRDIEAVQRQGKRKRPEL